MQKGQRSAQFSYFLGVPHSPPGFSSQRSACLVVTYLPKLHRTLPVTLSPLGSWLCPHFVSPEGFLAQSAEAAKPGEKALAPHPHPAALPGAGAAVCSCCGAPRARPRPQAAESVRLCGRH